MALLDIRNLNIEIQTPNGRIKLWTASIFRNEVKF